MQRQNRSVFRALAGFSALSLGLLACRPVLAVGWEELVLIIVLIAILLGPALFRIYRILGKIQNETREKKEK